VREGNAYRIAAPVQNLVRFRAANLLSPDFSSGAEGYDVIFCRNVLIYFQQDKQRQVITNLARRLCPSGVLFVGPAEGCLVMESGFAAMSQRMSFGFQRRVETPGAKQPNTFISRTDPVKSLRQRSSRSKSEIAAAVRTPPRVDTPANDGKDKIANPLPDLALAQAHADAGRLTEAESICVQLLGSPRLSADVYALLGVIQDALGRANDAEGNFRRAIYLDPEHHHALIHLASLADRKNDFVTAKRLRSRARRSEKGQ
jgi:chemotaxis protein methyltransferase WspC